MTSSESGSSSMLSWFERRAGGPGGTSAEQLFFIALGSVLGATALILCLLGLLCCVLQRNALRRRRQRVRAAVGLHYASPDSRAQLLATGAHARNGNGTGNGDRNGNGDAHSPDGVLTIH